MTDVTRPYRRLINTTANREDGVFTYDVTWLLGVDVDPDADEMLADEIASQFVSLPNEGSRYPNNLMATCRKVSVSYVERGFYHYTAHYSSENSIQGEPATDQNPLWDRPILRWVGSTESRAIYKDRNGDGILNSAGDPIIETFDDNIIGVTVQSNVENVPSWLLDYRNSVNDRKIVVGGLTIDANIARLTFPGDFISEVKTRNNIEYYVFKFELQFDEQNAWKGQPLDAGFREKTFISDGAGGFTLTTTNILNGDKTEITEPAPLDGAGNKLDPPTPSTAVFIDVEKYQERNFGVLPGVDNF